MKEQIAIGLAALVIVFSFIAIDNHWQPVQAAKPADPVVVPCQEINVATVSDGMVIKVFRCQPESGAPYLLNSLGFMVPEPY